MSLLVLDILHTLACYSFEASCLEFFLDVLLLMEMLIVIKIDIPILNIVS